jgi:hypothetical protein
MVQITAGCDEMRNFLISETVQPFKPTKNNLFIRYYVFYILAESSVSLSYKISTRFPSCRYSQNSEFL